MKILVATPVHEDRVGTDYMVSFVEMLAQISRDFPGAALRLKFKRSTALTLCRNAFASECLADTSYSHLLFIDSDIGYPYSLIKKMISAKKDVVGALYPMRTTPPRFTGREFIIKDEKGQSPVHKGGLVRVKAAGTGIMLIRRTVFEQLREAFPALWLPHGVHWYRENGFDFPILECFNHLPSHEGSFLSEDLSFCKRWTESVGGEIWANIDEVVSHSGEEVFKGRLLDHLHYAPLRDPATDG